jgi:hypothetical protein
MKRKRRNGAGIARRTGCSPNQGFDGGSVDDPSRNGWMFKKLSTRQHAGHPAGFLDGIGRRASARRRPTEKQKSQLTLSWRCRAQSKLVSRQFAIEDFFVPPTGFGNYCSSVEDVFTIVCKYPLN